MRRPLLLIASTSILFLLLPEAAQAQRQRIFPDENEGDYVYAHSAVYVPIEIGMFQPESWVASVNSLARESKTQWIEAGWMMKMEDPDCYHPYACAFSSSVDELGLEHFTLDEGHPYINGMRPWFKLQTQDCKTYGSAHGVQGNWNGLLSVTWTTETTFDEVINGLEDSGPFAGLFLGSGQDTNRWTENTNIKRRHEPCDISTGTNGWNFQTVDPNEVPGTVTGLGGSAWRISVP